MPNFKESCFCWFASAPKAHGASRGVLMRDKKWLKGAPITISFMDGDAAMQQRVRQAALGWLKPAGGPCNLNFTFSDDPRSFVRISFKFRGSWSVVGTTCKDVPLGQPTMNFGWLNTLSTDDEVRRVVLHEFGHALGLVHEHQNPGDGKIKWNRPEVIKDLSGPPNNWDQATIEHNMFEPVDINETNLTPLDRASIMMYPIPASWTTDGFSVGLNNALSPMDRSFMATQYA